MANDLLRGRQTVAPLTNKSGGGVVAGDVVILDSANASSFTTTSSAAQTADWVGVALETIANNSTGRVVLFGYAPIVNLASSASLGDYLRTHSVAKQAQRFSSTGAGDFGQVLGTGTTPAAIIWARPDQGTAGIRIDEADTSPDVSNITRITVSNGTLTDNGSGHVTLTTGGGGSGNTTSQSAFGSRPAAGTSGNLHFPTDGYSIARDDGANWDPYGPLFALTTPPAVSGWTWVNQGGATATDDRDGILLTCPAGTGNNFRALVRSAPGTPYTVTAAFLMAFPAVNFNSAGLIFRQSSDGKMATLSIANAVKDFALIKMNSATSYSGANYSGGFTQAPTMGPLLWFRIADNGTNRICSWSPDGRNWVQIHSVGRTDFLTADQVGFYGEAVNASYGPIVNLLSWAVA